MYVRTRKYLSMKTVCPCYLFDIGTMLLRYLAEEKYVFRAIDRLTSRGYVFIQMRRQRIAPGRAFQEAAPSLSLAYTLNLSTNVERLNSTSYRTFHVLMREGKSWNL